MAAAVASPLRDRQTSNAGEGFSPGGTRRSFGGTTAASEMARARSTGTLRMQKSSHNLVQNCLIKELEEKVQAQARKQMDEERASREREMKKQREESMAKLKKDGERRNTKIEEVKSRASSMMEGKQTEMAQKQAEAAEARSRRVAEMEAERKEATIRAQQERREKSKQRQEQLHEEQMKHLHKLCDKHLAKHKDTVDRMEEALSQRQATAEKFVQKQQETAQKAKQNQEQARLEEQERNQELLQRLEKAQVKRETDASKTKDTLSQKNTKQRVAFEGRLERLEADEKENPKISRRLLQMERMAQSAPTSPSGGPPQSPLQRRTSSDPLFPSEVRQEKVQSNRRELFRAQSANDCRLINQFENKRGRVDHINGTKAQVDKVHAASMKSALHNRDSFRDRVHDMKTMNASPEKMLAMAERISPSGAGKHKINELFGKLGVKRSGHVPAADEEDKTSPAALF